jgi:hypothetical protein
MSTLLLALTVALALIVGALAVLTWWLIRERRRRERDHVPAAIYRSRHAAIYRSNHATRRPQHSGGTAAPAVHVIGLVPQERRQLAMDEPTEALRVLTATKPRRRRRKPRKTAQAQTGVEGLDPEVIEISKRLKLKLGLAEGDDDAS